MLVLISQSRSLQRSRGRVVSHCADRRRRFVDDEDGEVDGFARDTGELTQSKSRSR